MYDKCYFCLDQLPKLKKESTASFFVNFGGAGVQKSRPTLLYNQRKYMNINYFVRKEKQVDLQKKIQSSNMLNAVSEATMIWNFHISILFMEINC